MFSHYWDVLLVDDEPDVLTVTKIALKGLTVYGLPLRIHEAHSKAHAVDLLRTGLAAGMEGIERVAVAFIDVVMETDSAGLDLCHYIRESMGNRATQLYVRTGQPGIAPEKAVVDQYEINGYILKTDATPDKLYVLLKSGIRQYYAATMARAYSNLMLRVVPVSSSRDAIAWELDAFVRGMCGGVGVDAVAGPADARMSYIADNEVIAGNWHADPARVRAQRDRLLAGQGMSFGKDKCVVDGNDVVLQIAASDFTSEMSGEVSFLLRATRTSDVFASSDHVELISFDEQQMRRLIDTESRIAAKLLLNLSRATALKLVERSSWRG